MDGDCDDTDPNVNPDAAEINGNGIDDDCDGSIDYGLVDTDGDGVADRYDTLSNNWGYAEGHEFAFGSKHDPEGNIWVALGLSGS